MFKKIALIVLCLVLVAAFGLFCYNRYQSNYERYYDFLGPQLSEEQKETISAACAEAGITPVNWEAEDWEAGAVRYYGNFKGYDVIFLFPESITREPNYYFFGIAVAKIPYGGCEFYAYKDGKVCTVMQLVEEGTFVYDDLADILKQHNHRRYDNYPKAGGNSWSDTLVIGLYVLHVLICECMQRQKGVLNILKNCFAFS